MTSEPRIVAESVSKWFGPLVAVSDVSFDVGPGVTALLGPNGAGKSTMFRMLCGLARPSKGTVRVLGRDPRADPDVARRIGLVPQEMNFNQFETVTTILLNQAGFYGIPRRVAHSRMEQYLVQLQLWDKRNAVSRTLSGGMKRRLMIARALLHEPRLLILDEPTAGVDIEVRRSMWDFIRKINAAGTTNVDFQNCSLTFNQATGAGGAVSASRGRRPAVPATAGPSGRGGLDTSGVGCA